MSAVNSCIYRGEVFHKRFAPSIHAFSYQMDYLFLDLDEIATVFAKSPLWSHDRWNLVNFRRSDYLPGEHKDLKQEVYAQIKAKGGEFNGQVYLLTTLRALGYCMNPISLFYCVKPSGELQYVLAEVHNTPWDERHTYLLEGPDFKESTEKDFHVSPFMPMNTTYDWRITSPDDELVVAINVKQEAQPLFTASMTLERQVINQASISALVLSQARQSFKTISAIYLQAAKLWWKKVPFYKHPNKNKLQETN